MKPKREVVWWDKTGVARPQDGGQKITLQGWGHWTVGQGPSPHVGDYVLLPHDRDNPNSEMARYLVTEFRYEFDPPDMYLMRATFAPRSAAQKGKRS